jgi:hypothetical protein
MVCGWMSLSRVAEGHRAPRGFAPDRLSQPRHAAVAIEMHAAGASK